MQKQKHKILTKTTKKIQLYCPVSCPNGLIILDPRSICKSAGSRLCFPPCLFIYFVFSSFVYSSIGCCHGEGRCPWRAAQQESISDG